MTTSVFRWIIANVPLSAEIRASIEDFVVPDELAAAITRPLARFDERAAYAVRSSATAEDMPTASFAGQQDVAIKGLVTEWAAR